MADVTEDTIKIVISADAGDAVENINTVGDAADGLNDKIKSLNTTLASFKSSANKGFSGIADTFSSISGSASGLSDFGKDIDGITSGLEKLSNIDEGTPQDAGAQLKAISEALGTLDGVDTNKLSSIASSLSALPSALSALNNGSNMEAISEAGDNLDALADAASKASSIGSGIASLGQGLKSIPQGLEAFAYNDYEEGIQQFGAVLGELLETLTAFDDESRENAAALKTFADGFKTLAKVGADSTDLEKNLEALVPIISNFVNELSGSVDDATLERFSKLATAVNQVAQAYNKLAPAQKAVTQVSGDNTKQQRVLIQQLSLVQQLSSALNTVSGKFVNIGKMGFSKLVSGAEAYASAIAKVTSKLSSYAKTYLSYMAQVATIPLDNFKAKLESINTSMSKILATIGRIVLYRAIRSTLTAIINGISTGISNLYQWALLTGNTFSDSMDSMATSMQYFQNSIGAAASELLDALAPALEQIIDWVTDVINAVNQFLAAITGKSTWRKAVRTQTSYADAATDTADATDDATDAEKTYENTVMGFDELNKLNSTSDSSSSTTPPSSSSSTPDYSSMFEEDPVDDWYKQFANTDDWTELGKKIADEINSWESQIDWDSIDKTAAKWSKRIWTAFNGFVEERDWSSFGYTIGRALNVGLHFVDDIAQNADFTDFGAGLAGALNTAANTIDWTALGHVMTDGLKVSLETLHGFLNGNSTYAGFDFETLRKKLNVAIDAAFANLDWNTAITDVTHGLAEVALTFVSGINEVIKNIDNVVQNYDWTNWGSTIGTYLNQAVNEIDWNTLGSFISDGLKIAFNALNGFLQTFNWDQFRTDINNALNSAFNNIDWHTAINDITTAFGQIALTFVSGINTVIQNFNSVVYTHDWTQWGSDVGSYLNQAVQNIDWNAVGQFIVSGLYIAFNALDGFLQSFDWNSFGTGIENAITTAFNSIDWAQAGMDINNLANHLLDVIEQAISAINWDDINSFLEGLNIPELLGRALLDIAMLIGKAFVENLKTGTGFFIDTVFIIWITSKIASLGTTVATLLLKWNLFTTGTTVGTEAGTGLLTGLWSKISGSALGTKISTWLTENVGASGTTTAASSVGSAIGSALGFAVGVGINLDGLHSQVENGFSVGSFAETVGGAALTGASIGSAFGVPILGAGVGAAVGVSESVVANWGSISDWVSTNVGQPISDTFSWVGNNISTGVSNATTAWNNFGSDASAAWQTTEDNWNNQIVQPISNGFDSIVSWATTNGTQMGNNLSNAISSTASNVSNSAGQLASDIQSGIGTAVDNAKSWGSNVGSNVSSGISSAVSWVGNAASNVASTIGNGVGTAVDNAKTWGSNVSSNVSNGISSATQWVSNAAGGVYNAVSSPISSAINAAKIWGSNTGVNISNGLGSTIRSVGSSANSLGQQAQSVFNSVISSASWWGSDIGFNIANGIRSAISSVRSAASNVASVISSYLHFSEPDVGPLSDFSTYAPDMMSSLATGIDQNKYLVTDSVNDLASSMSVDLSDTLNIDYSQMYSNTALEGTLSSDTPINVYIGDEKLDSVIAKSDQRVNLRSGGR